jgi:hypothetical protein
MVGIDKRNITIVRIVIKRITPLRTDIWEIEKIVGFLKTRNLSGGI